MEDVLAALVPVRALVREKTQELLDYANPELAGKHVFTRDWFLTSGEAAVAIVVAYLVFVVFGSLVMRFIVRRPIKVFGWFKYFYNPLQVVLCSWMLIEAGRQAYKLDNNTGKVIGNSFDPERRGIAEVVYVFYLSKVLDFVDTFFIVLEMRWRQLSFLHVYHHSTIFFTYWVIISVGYDGDIYATVVLNGFVHAVMYGYYTLTALRLYAPVRDAKVGTVLFTDNGRTRVEGSQEKDLRKAVLPCRPYSPWWKQIITYLQMVQFILMNAQAIYLLMNETEYPTPVITLYLVYIQTLFWLFFHFAVRNYCSGGNKKKGKKGKRE